MSTHIVLASQSPYRKAQLTQLGFQFQAVVPRVDETALKAHGPKDLFELTRYLAFHKAQSLQGEFPNSIVLGSDQIAEVDGHRLDKPGTRPLAHAQLKRLQGRKHRLLTSLVVLSADQVQTFTDISVIELYPLSDVEIEAYLDLDQPFDCAGSYKIERGGMALIKAIESQDFSAIQGLPLLSLGVGLRNLKVELKDLWAAT